MCALSLFLSLDLGNFSGYLLLFIDVRALIREVIWARTEPALCQLLVQ